MTKYQQAAVMSSHGQVTFRVGSGIVDGCEVYADEPDDFAAPDEDARHLQRIRAVDVREWERQYGEKVTEASYDILDFGYWHQDPDTGLLIYEPPVEDWRREFRQVRPTSTTSDE